MSYAILKAVHIVGAVLFLGAGLMIAWFNLRASWTRDPKVIAWFSREIVLADTLFTTPAALIMPISGVWMVLKVGIPWSTPWILFGILGYVGTGLLWLPAVWLQIRMRRAATEAAERGEPIPAQYWRDLRVWRWLGYPAFAMAVALVWVMVTKRVGF